MPIQNVAIRRVTRVEGYTVHLYKQSQPGGGRGKGAKKADRQPRWRCREGDEVDGADEF